MDYFSKVRQQAVDKRLEKSGMRISFFSEIYACIWNGDDLQLDKYIDDEFRKYIDIMMENRETAQNIFFCLMGICMFMANYAGMLESVNETIGRYYTERLKKCHDVEQIKQLNETMMKDYTKEIKKVRAESSTTPLLGKCRSYIANHIYENIMVSDLSKFCGMSISTFERHLKKESGFSPRRVILEERIKKAAFLLADTELSCAQISASLNFCSQSYFTARFKEQTGETPATYRMRMRTV